MAIDPNILLQRTVPDVGSALLRGLQGVQAIQSMQQAAAEAPLRQQVLEQSIQTKKFEADLLKSGVAASRLKPFIASKDYGKFSEELKRAGLDQEDIDMLDTYARANRWDELGTVADQYIQTARDAGVFGKLSGADTYETSASKNIRLLNDLETQLRNGEITEDQFYARRAIILRESTVDIGGGATGVVRPGETAVTPYTMGAGGTGGATGAAGGGVGAAGAIRGGGDRAARTGMSPQQFEDLLRQQGVPEETIRTIGQARAQEPRGAVTPDQLQPPPPPTGTVPPETLSQRIANADKLREFTKRYGAETAKNVAELENTSDLFQVNKSGFDEVYPEVRLGETLAKAPDSRIGQIFSQGIGNVIQGLPEVDADYELEQAFRAAVGLIPFPPGAQSQAEQEAREREVGSLTDPKISKDVRLKGMARLLNREQTKAKTRWDIANRRREELGLAPIPNPFEKMAPRQGTGAAAPTGTGGGQGVPPGVDPADWAVMTPEEKALWQ